MKRTIGIIRVSKVGKREGESFASPDIQRERIEEACKRERSRLVKFYEELDVSGGKPLADRSGLSQAVADLEAGRADTLMVAYFDRLVRSLKVQAEVVERVERAGGDIFTLDHGQITNGSAAKRLEANIVGAMAQFFREQSGEKTAEAQGAAVERGVAPWPKVPPGYRRREDGVFELDENAAAMVEAFRMRAAGATVREVRAFLADNGIRRTYGAVMRILQSRVYLGEVRFGRFANVNAHPAIVDRDTFRRVQSLVVAKGRQARSQRLLARLGVLHCGTCGSRMVLSTTQHGRYSLYRCSPASGDCERRVTISADSVEGIVVSAVKHALANVEGRASAEQGARAAAAVAERAERDLDVALRAFAAADVQDEPGAVERLSELREVRDRARERAEHLGARRSVVAINAARDWDRLTLDEQRGLVRSVIDRVTVAPGRGPDRVRVQLLGE